MQPSNPPSPLASRDLRAHNFSPGPGELPAKVLEEAAEALIRLPDTPLSILGISHRSEYFTDMVEELDANIRQLTCMPDDYECLFLQGGGSLQFSMIPMNFLRGQSLPAAYIDSGYWSAKAIPEAQREGDVQVLWSGKEMGYNCLPEPAYINTDRDFAYLHYASNETVEGLQFFTEPPCSDQTPRICDMSSDFLSRPFDINRYDMIYAHAQKNLGPAGVSVCIIHKSLLKRIPGGLHSMLDYRNHISMRSAYNTPPVFPIYVVMLLTRWLLHDIGGLENMNRINRTKAENLYQTIDHSGGFYTCTASKAHRSLMNVVFTLPSESLDEKFLQEARAAGFYGLEGHRTVGGLRASLYNGVAPESVSALTMFMDEFCRHNG